MREPKKTKRFKVGDAVLDRVTGQRGIVQQVFAVTFTREPEGGYTALVPALPGCVSYGETIEEATRNVRQAIELHLENLKAHHEDVPTQPAAAQVFTTLVYV